MSLHLGNISSHIQRDELEHVFQRFGHCTVRLKDKFGFVIYEYPGNAENALRTLRGKKICGERITVSWSNRQPRPLLRHARGGGTYKAPRGRYYPREDYANRKLGLDVQDGNRKGSRQLDDSVELDSADLIHEATGHQLNNTGDYLADKHHDFVHDLPDEGGCIAPNFLENDRWGAQVIPNDLENELHFDRYEPYQGDDRKEQVDIHTSSHFGGTSLVRKSQEKSEIEQVDYRTMEHLHNSKSQYSCYACGEVGHKKHKCPRELKRRPTRFRGPLDLDRNAASAGWHKSDREASVSKNRQRLLFHENSPWGRLVNGVGEKEYQHRKRSRRRDATPEGHHSKKARVPVSSSIHSDYTASRSWSRSRSQRSLSGSHSHSRSKSLPSRKDSLSSKSRSGSTSSHPRSKHFKSQSQSRSSSPSSLSLSASLSQPLPSSPNKVQINEMDSLVNSSNPEFKGTSVEVGPLVKCDAAWDESKLEKLDVENGSSAAPMKLDEDLPNNHFQSSNDLDNNFIASGVCELKKSCILQSDNGGHSAGNYSPKSLRETSEVKSDGLVRADKSIALKDLGTEALTRSHATNLPSISSKEICMLLKSYGLECPNENENDLSPESFFGAARFWPWDIVYYRRLKKGPISKDNYARRLAQNEEFGIVDKYVRSSSGWAELTDETP